MRLIVLDENFEAVGAIAIFNTLIWDRRYYEPGVFELYAPVDTFPLLNTGKYICRNDRDELAVIRNPCYKQNNAGERSAYAKGYFVESLIGNRVINSTQNLTGTPEDIMRSLVNTFVINPSDGNRKMPIVRLGTRKGFGTSVRVQTTGANLSDKLYEIGQTQEMSHRLVYDYENNILTFEVWQGLDRTDSQEVNSWAIFSNSFYNVKDVIYERNDSEYKNYAYVAGEGEGAARVVVEIDIRSSTTEERRELYVDARDLQSSYYDSNNVEHHYTAAQYREMLRQRGLEKLSEYNMIEIVNSNIDPGANLVYETDFDLGDLCTYQNTELGITCTKRITQIQEVYEGVKTSLVLTFGTDDASTITKIIRRETG